MKTLGLIFFSLIVVSCSLSTPKVAKTSVEDLNNFMNDWHREVANSNFDAYFSKIDSLGFFIGTDASEVWTKAEFASFSRPYFDKKQTWDFKPLSRHFYINEASNMAWFDEVLDTWMGVCRGSGVLQQKDGKWKIMQYVLSVTIPNDDIKLVIAAKKVNDSIAKAKFKKY
ncbi:MAG: hypothetical protein COS42_07435 [Flavobacteriales bacterium CG03_land_8_20_14_0_80_35_15]|nr:MAG: hypothetical protein COS42_07435 [Flavobacteriales bacterium CG03_land_8_20_14_0_80_35_15]